MKWTRAISASVVGLAVLATAAASMGAGARKDQFVGTWKIEAMAEGAGKDFKDTLTFSPTMLTAAALKAKGWEPAEYEGDYRGVQIASFTATMKNKKDNGEMKWSGTLAAGQIKGTIVIKTDSKGEERYNYTGERTAK